jgi:Protein of unknown function (DUF3106)
MSPSSHIPRVRPAIAIAAGLAVLVLSLASLAVRADPPAVTAGVEWSQLDPSQRELLGKFQGQWSQLPPERQAALAKGSQRWLTMSPEQRGQARDRFENWRELPPQQRQQARERWKEFQSLPPDEQARVRGNFQRFRQLPPEQKQKLRDRWQHLTPDQRAHARERAMERRKVEGRHPEPHRGPGG